MQLSARELSLFILKCILLGMISYAVAGLAAAWVFVVSTDHHPHSMVEILYIMLPLAMGSLGSAAGGVLALLQRKSGSFAAVGKGLAIVGFLSVAAIVAFFYWPMILGQ